MRLLCSSIIGTAHKEPNTQNFPRQASRPEALLCRASRLFVASQILTAVQDVLLPSNPKGKGKKKIQDSQSGLVLYLIYWRAIGDVIELNLFLFLYFNLQFTVRKRHFAVSHHFVVCSLSYQRHVVGDVVAEPSIAAAMQTTCLTLQLYPAGPWRWTWGDTLQSLLV